MNEWINKWIATLRIIEKNKNKLILYLITTQVDIVIGKEASHVSQETSNNLKEYLIPIIIINNNTNKNIIINRKRNINKI